MTSLLAGLGMSQTFRFAAAPHLEGESLVALLEEWSRPPHPLHVLYPPNRRLNAKLRVFIDWVSNVFTKIL
jgi:LysR family transcriptional regulator for bpeEF and oprC